MCILIQTTPICCHKWLEMAVNDIKWLKNDWKSSIKIENCRRWFKKAENDHIWVNMDEYDIKYTKITGKPSKMVEKQSKMTENSWKWLEIFENCREIAKNDEINTTWDRKMVEKDWIRLNIAKNARKMTKNDQKWWENCLILVPKWPKRL